MNLPPVATTVARMTAAHGSLQRAREQAAQHRHAYTSDPMQYRYWSAVLMEMDRHSKEPQ